MVDTTGSELGTGGPLPAQAAGHRIALPILLWLACVLLLAGGCAGRNADPFERTNRWIDNANDFVDRAIVKDVAMAYQRRVPTVLQDGIGNFFTNLATLNVILNDHLQGRFARGWRNTERVAINTTVGVLGVMDIAEEWGYQRHRNDFGITLGKWGCKPGPYLVLPILGPSCARDVPALIVARLTNPLFWAGLPPEVGIPLDVTSFVDQRARLQPQIDFRERAALDRYTFSRDVYLRYREARIQEGQAIPEEPSMEEEEPMEEELPSEAPAATDYLR